MWTVRRKGDLFKGQMGWGGVSFLMADGSEPKPPPRDPVKGALKIHRDAVVPNGVQRSSGVGSYLVTADVNLNFRRLRLHGIRYFNSVNIELGYKHLAIYLPPLKLCHETDDQDSFGGFASRPHNLIRSCKITLK
jgi:hypothetical protein